MAKQNVNGTRDWTRYEIELLVDASVENINFGMLMPGNGTAWFDDLVIELDVQPYLDAEKFDLGFESSSPCGFFTGGNGYRVDLDAEAARSGKQSLRIRHLGQSASSSDPKAASAGATDSEIDWAIQNARV